jgi:hypothetical protein
MVSRCSFSPALVTGRYLHDQWEHVRSYKDVGILVVKLEQMARAMFLSKVCKNCTMVGDTLRPWLKMVFGHWRRVMNIFGPLDEAGQVGLGMNVLTCNTNQRSVHHSECEQHTDTEWCAWQRGVADAVRCTQVVTDDQ